MRERSREHEPEGEVVEAHGRLVKTSKQARLAKERLEAREGEAGPTREGRSKEGTSSTGCQAEHRTREEGVRATSNCCICAGWWSCNRGNASRPCDQLVAVARHF